VKSALFSFFSLVEFFITGDRPPLPESVGQKIINLSIVLAEIWVGKDLHSIFAFFGKARTKKLIFQN